jgi:hypothetical protein
MEKIIKTVTVMRRQWAEPDANGYRKEVDPIEAQVIIEIDVVELAQRMSHRVWSTKKGEATTNEGTVIVRRLP